MNSPDSKTLLSFLKSQANPSNVEGMKRFGINPHHTYGVSMPVLRALAKRTGKGHALAQELWDSGIHEARILATLIDDKNQVSERQMESWAKDFDSWDVVDQCCGNLFRHTPYAYTKAVEWSSRREEFVKRAGFVLMAGLAVCDKKTDDREFLRFFPLLIRESTDERNFVRKAVNWALRQMGKRSAFLHKEAIQTANKIQCLPSKSARWIAADALRELQNPRRYVKKRV